MLTFSSFRKLNLKYTLFILLFVNNATNAQYGGFADLPGQYCQTRTGGTHCCDGRIDECSVPIFGTLCYCDQFCDRTKNPDCCPDYWDVCLGRPRPRRPTALGLAKHCPVENGLVLKHKEKTKINCHQCECIDGVLTCDDIERCLVDENLLNLLENAALSGDISWTAKNHSFFWGRKLNGGMKMLTGTLKPGKQSMNMHPIKLHYDINEIPRSFDARDQWSGLGEVKNQGWCGASWVFSTLGVVEDRLAIGSGGLESLVLSSQNLLSCNRRGQQACNGGHVERAWNFLRRKGVVSESCYPYVSGVSGTSDKCKFPRAPKSLQRSCPRDQFPLDRDEPYTTEPAYRIASNEHDIMWEIMTNGPVQALMKVYQDFFPYSGGIYSRQNIDSNGHFHFHSVKMIGWGEEYTTYGTEKYWLAMNSWGKEWGENGLFRIRRGHNETDIEQFILAVRSHLAEDENSLRRRKRS